MSTRWIDLLDPTREELLAALPSGVDPDVLETLTAPPGNEHTRPFLESHGAYVLGVLLDGQPLTNDNRIVYCEVDVVATPDLLVTIRKTPEAGTPWHPGPLEIAVARGVSVGELLYRLVDDVAASFLDVVVALDAQIDELEDHIDDWPSETVRRRLGACATTSSMRGEPSEPCAEPYDASSTSASTSGTRGCSPRRSSAWSRTRTRR